MDSAVVVGVGSAVVVVSVLPLVVEAVDAVGVKDDSVLVAVVVVVVGGDSENVGVGVVASSGTGVSWAFSPLPQPATDINATTRIVSQGRDTTNFLVSHPRKFKYLTRM